MTTEDGWHVTTHWFAVDGGVICAGVDIRSFSDDGTSNPIFGFFADDDTPQQVTRVGMNAIQLGRIVAEHRPKALRRLREVADQFPPGERTLGLEGVGETYRQLVSAMSNPRRHSTQENRRRACELYLGGNRPQTIADLMFGQGVTVRGEPPTAELVRRWIRQSKASGLMDEVRTEQEEQP